MPGFKVTITRKKKGAKLTPPVFTAADVKEPYAMALTAIIANVKAGLQANGKPIKRNALSTSKRKRARGQVPPRSLIDRKKRFILRGQYRRRLLGRGKAIRGFQVIHKGVTGKGRELLPLVLDAGYVGWFRPSPKEFMRIVKVIRASISRSQRKHVRVRGRFRND